MKRQRESDGHGSDGSDRAKRCRDGTPNRRTTKPTHREILQILDKNLPEEIKDIQQILRSEHNQTVNSPHVLEALSRNQTDRSDDLSARLDLLGFQLNNDDEFRPPNSPCNPDVLKVILDVKDKLSKAVGYYIRLQDYLSSLKSREDHFASKCEKAIDFIDDIIGAYGECLKKTAHYFERRTEMVEKANERPGIADNFAAILVYDEVEMFSCKSSLMEAVKNHETILRYSQPFRKYLTENEDEEEEEEIEEENPEEEEQEEDEEEEQEEDEEDEEEDEAEEEVEDCP